MRPGDKLNLIIAEDNEADVYLIRESLRAAGGEFSAEIASNGEKALALIERFAQTPEHKLRGIILDLNLTTHSGFEVLQRVRELPALAEVPVVILTSSESPRDRLEAERLGTSGFFRKPIELQEFMSMGRRIAELFGM